MVRYIIYTDCIEVIVLKALLIQNTVVIEQRCGCIVFTIKKFKGNIINI